MKKTENPMSKVNQIEEEAFDDISLPDHEEGDGYYIFKPSQLQSFKQAIIEEVLEKAEVCPDCGGHGWYPDYGSD